jgi:hypothetical protein
VFERADVSSPRVAALPQTIDFIAGFRAIRGRLFFGFFLLAKQKKETRHRRNAFKNQPAASKTPSVVTEKQSMLQATHSVVTEKQSMLQATHSVVTAQH